ncbi:hypothetical protein M0R45_006548 [Rubus argutus]|uniref:Uncharacterized protein n=1 Tax=Rubus argutus TaxID=59490 RepID=A0AAW1YR84_RUBAR
MSSSSAQPQSRCHHHRRSCSEPVLSVPVDSSSSITVASPVFPSHTEISLHRSSLPATRKSPLPSLTSSKSSLPLSSTTVAVILSQLLRRPELLCCFEK